MDDNIDIIYIYMYVILIYGLASRFFCTSSYEPLNKDSSQVPQIFPAPYSPWVVSHVQLPAWPSNGRTTSSCSWGPANSFISLLLVHTLINYITMTITIYHYIKLCRDIYIYYTIETYLGWYRIMIPAWCEFMADTASRTMDGAYKQMNYDGLWMYGRYI